MEKSIREYLANPYDEKENWYPWYDWFCSEKSLVNRGIKLLTKLKSIVNSPKINQDTMYVFYKNNCPMFGSTYDDFRICDIKTGNVIYTIIPKIVGKSEVWGSENDFQKVLVIGTWNDVKNYFMKG